MPNHISVNTALHAALIPLHFFARAYPSIAEFVFPFFLAVAVVLFFRIRGESGRIGHKLLGLAVFQHVRSAQMGPFVE